MSPQFVWTIAGLVLTVATLAGVGISAVRATDAASVKLVAAEVSAVVQAARLWTNNKDWNGTYEHLTPPDLKPYFPTLNIWDEGIGSNVMPSVNYSLSPTPNLLGLIVKVTFTEGDSAGLAPQIIQHLNLGSCTAAPVSEEEALTYTCNEAPL